jgi:hypothetical protein
MSYGTGPNGELTTPRGCRVDNGRCIAHMEHYGGTDFKLVFGGGGTYIVGRHSVEAWVNTFCNEVDPGCAWNSLLATGQLAARPFEERFDGELKACFTADPPFYTPIPTGRPFCPELPRR